MLSPNLNFDSKLKLSDLINFDNGCWAEFIVREVFNEANSSIILDILIQFFPSDRRYWWLSNHRHYQVKSGYWLVRIGYHRSWELFNKEREENLRKKVWNFQGPPKLRQFICRACKGSLAVKESLYRRHITTNRTCEVCGAEEETLIHSLFDCTAAHDIWARSNVLGLLLEAPSSSFKDRFVWMAEKVANEELRVFCSLLWTAWFFRNEKIHKRVATGLLKIAARFTKLVKDYTEYAQRVFSSTASGVAMATGGGVGLGVVIRDANGRLLAAAVKRTNARWEEEKAVVAAMKYGIRVADRL